MGRTASFLVLVWLALTEASISGCGPDEIREVEGGQVTTFTCAPEDIKSKQSRNVTVFISYHYRNAHFVERLATCARDSCHQLSTFGGTFVTNIVGDGIVAVIVKGTNNAVIDRNIWILNGSLLCTTDPDNKSSPAAWCNITYVYPAKNVSCWADVTPRSLSVSCDVVSIYSSRRLYYCRLIRVDETSGNTTLQTVPITTFPTMETVALSEVKVSGSCQLAATVSSGERSSAYYVSTVPGAEVYLVKLPSSEVAFAAGEVCAGLSCAGENLVSPVGCQKKKCRCSSSSSSWSWRRKVLYDHVSD